MKPYALIITSPAFANGAPIPDQYACRGVNISPPLMVSGVPLRAASMTLVMHDRDAPGGDFVHWNLWNISPLPSSLPAGSVPNNAILGVNSFGTLTYGGPCPPAVTHR